MDSEGSVDLSSEMPGEEEKMIGKTMPLLQELSNFVDRCATITINFVHQLAALYDSREPNWYKSTYRHVRLTPAWEALGKYRCIAEFCPVICMEYSSYVDRHRFPCLCIVRLI